jgi:hypothetical protein
MSSTYKLQPLGKRHRIHRKGGCELIRLRWQGFRTPVTDPLHLGFDPGNALCDPVISISGRIAVCHHPNPNGYQWNVNDTT